MCSLLHFEAWHVAETLGIACSVYRCQELDNAEIQFTLLKEKLPLLLQCVPESTKEQVQEVVTLCRSNTSWSLAHIAAHLGLMDMIKHPAVKRCD